jgi:hypothetical protein
MKKIFRSSIAVSLMAWSAMAADSSPDRYLDKEKRTLSPGNTTYVIDPLKGDDANLAGKPWRTFGKLNALTLAPGDKVLVAPGQQEESLNLKRKMEIWSSRAKYCNYGEWIPQSRRFLFTQKVS